MQRGLNHGSGGVLHAVGREEVSVGLTHISPSHCELAARHRVYRLMDRSAHFPDHPAPANLDHEWNATVEAFRWLLIFGFPANVAAPRLMPELFSDALDDAIDLARRMTRNPFGHAA